MTSTSPPKFKLQVAIVGSGPSGFYAAEALAAAIPDVAITLIERLPVPYGLVRSGIAPDHPKLKQTTLVFDRIASHPSVSFVGNVSVGIDISVEELQQTHHCVILAYGASHERRMEIPGVGLRGSFSATDFVGWYNGHPDHTHHEFDFDTESAVIVGQGNVSIDVARILCKSVDELKNTDIAAPALEALSKSRIRSVHVVGRRGPAQAKFSPGELRELGLLQGCSTHVNACDLRLGDVCQIEATSKHHPGVTAVIKAFSAFSVNSSSANIARTCTFRFFGRPHSIIGEQRVEAVRFQRTKLAGEAFSQRAFDVDDIFDIPAGLVFRSIGYGGKKMPGVPFDDSSGTIPHEKGRVVDPSTKLPIPGLYATGWIKRGPIGIIGTNRADSLETVAGLIQDSAVPHIFKSGAAGLLRMLNDRAVLVVDYAGWQRIDAEEKMRGQIVGKPREKFTNVKEMLSVASPQAVTDGV